VAHRFFHDAFFVATEVRTTARQAGKDEQHGTLLVFFALLV